MKYKAWLLLLLFPGLVQAAQYIDERMIPPTITRDSEIAPTGTTGGTGICISNTGTPQPKVDFCNTVDVTTKTVLYKIPEVTIATLPANHALSVVTDASTASTCTSPGGSNKVICWWNGTTWVPVGSGGGGGGGTDPTPSLTETSTTVVSAKPFQSGNCTTNCTNITSSVTGAKTINFPDLAGDIAVGTPTSNSSIRNKSITFQIGSDTGSPLADTDDQKAVWRNNIGSMTISEVWCQSDTGSPVINLQRDDGTPANILTSNLTCSNLGVLGTIAAGEATLFMGDKIDFVMVSGASGAKRITISIKAVLN